MTDSEIKITVQKIRVTGKSRQLKASWAPDPPKPSKPSYRILETLYERIYKKTWHKLSVNPTLKDMIEKIPGENTNWERHKELNGARFYWVTDPTLTMLTLQGAVKEND